MFVCFKPQGKPTSLKTAQSSWVNLSRPLPKSKASLKSSALRRTGSTPSIASTHSELSTYSNNCKSTLYHTSGVVETVIARKANALRIIRIFVSRVSGKICILLPWSCSESLAEKKTNSLKNSLEIIVC